MDRFAPEYAFFTPGSLPRTPSGLAGPHRPAPALELQTCFPRGVCDGAKAAVIQEPAAVEHDTRDAFFDRALGNRPSDRFGAFDVSATHVLGELAFERRLDRGSRHERLPVHVVDHLRVDMRHAAEHAKPRPLRRAGDSLALSQ